MIEKKDEKYLQQGILHLTNYRLSRCKFEDGTWDSLLQGPNYLTNVSSEQFYRGKDLPMATIALEIEVLILLSHRCRELNIANRLITCPFQFLRYVQRPDV